MIPVALAEWRTNLEKVLRQYGRKVLKVDLYYIVFVYFLARYIKSLLILYDWYSIYMFTGRENEPLDVELLPELMLTIAKCDRVLTKPFGNSLLFVGR
jgi:hypothetical protein